METAAYKYLPIDLDGPSFRLLQLFKGSIADDVHCNLIEAWISQSEGGMPYNALSYTWGSMEKKATITVNGTLMHVTSNLFIALQNLRFEDEDRILWVDAICINQDDEQERGHQVRQMSEIYKEAEEVIIWLGNGSQETDFVMGFMRELDNNYAKAKHDWRLSAQLWIYRRSVIQPGLRDSSVDYTARWREGMEFMLMHPWFRRIWILQEVANARRATVVCGRKSISARIFAQVPSLLGLQPEPHCQAVLDIMPGFSRKESCKVSSK
ncbi:heterokaryon incompatibility protein-domain-containing protein [Tricladium varicosporioides]|nr:heterokaryon incompatibility protein-domain-containing protein [Hymenoscyphus varicosporioides]